MPTDVADKSYIKKHKLNDLLNELYLALTQNKPDSPVEFAIKHFQAKLPPPPPKPPQSPPPAPVIDATALLSKFFDGKIAALADDKNSEVNSHAGPVDNLNILVS